MTAQDQAGRGEAVAADGGACRARWRCSSPARSSWRSWTRTIIAPAAPHIAAELRRRSRCSQRRDHRVRAHAGRPHPDQRLAGRPVRRRGGFRRRDLAVHRSPPPAARLAPSLPVLTATRVLQGVGGAMMVPVGRLVVLRTTAKTDLIKAIAYLTWPALVAPVIAPAAGRRASTFASWRWIFLINVPLGLAGLVLARRLVPDVAADRAAPAGPARVRADRDRRRRAGHRPGELGRGRPDSASSPSRWSSPRLALAAAVRLPAADAAAAAGPAHPADPRPSASPRRGGSVFRR